MDSRLRGNDRNKPSPLLTPSSMPATRQPTVIPVKAGIQGNSLGI